MLHFILCRELVLGMPRIERVLLFWYTFGTICCFSHSGQTRCLYFNKWCNVLKINLSEKNSMWCQMYANTEDHIELKLYFNSRYPQHRFSAQRKMQHCAFHEEIHASEDWIFVRLSSLVLASERTINQNKFIV